MASDRFINKEQGLHGYTRIRYYSETNCDKSFLSRQKKKTPLTPILRPLDDPEDDLQLAQFKLQVSTQQGDQKNDMHSFDRYPDPSQGEESSLKLNIFSKRNIPQYSQSPKKEDQEKEFSQEDNNEGQQKEKRQENMEFFNKNSQRFHRRRCQSDTQDYLILHFLMEKTKGRKRVKRQ